MTGSCGWFFLSLETVVQAGLHATYPRNADVDQRDDFRGDVLPNALDSNDRRSGLHDFPGLSIPNAVAFQVPQYIQQRHA